MRSATDLGDSWAKIEADTLKPLGLGLQGMGASLYMKRRGLVGGLSLEQGPLQGSLVLGWEGLLEEKWQSAAVFSSGKCHGQTSLVGIAKCIGGCKELNTTEPLITHGGWDSVETGGKPCQDELASGEIAF